MTDKSMTGKPAAGKPVTARINVSGKAATKNNSSAPQEYFDHDGLWKDLIDRFFYLLLKRAIPELYAAADTSVKQRFLDKEFRDILNTGDPELHLSPHYADYVIEVPLKGGDVEWILLHIEIQRLKGGDLTVRMYRYQSFIFAHYGKVPVALAVITDKRPKKEAQFFVWERFGTKVTYGYNTLVLRAMNDEELLESENPVDLALYAAKCALRSKKELQKYTYLRNVVGLLAERGWSMEDKRDLMLFLERIMNLRNKQLRVQYREYQEQLDKEGKIVYISVAEEYYTEKGIEKGIEKGKEDMAREMAKKLLARGIAPDVIAESAGLPIDKIQAFTTHKN
jgi:hypothetical protein